MKQFLISWGLDSQMSLLPLNSTKYTEFQENSEENALENSILNKWKPPNSGPPIQLKSSIIIIQ